MAPRSPRAAASADEDAPQVASRDIPAADRVVSRADNAIRTRDGRIVDLNRLQSQNDDRFDLTKMGVVPERGWTYEWRVVKIKGAEATQQIADDEARGWTPVPADRYPGKIMPMGYKGPIERDGLMLKERDERATAMARHYESKAARDQLQISRSMTGLMSKFTPGAGAIFDQVDNAAERGSFVRTERAPAGTPPDQKNYQYVLEE